jgi:hypothetical protein
MLGLRHLSAKFLAHSFRKRAFFVEVVLHELRLRMIDIGLFKIVMPSLGKDFDNWDKSFLWEFESQSIDNFNGWILDIDGFINFEKFSQSMGFL